MRCAVLGAGSWGTALASLLAGKGFPVTAWDKDVPVLDEIVRAHRNERYLPGVALPPALPRPASHTSAAAKSWTRTPARGANRAIPVLPEAIVVFVMPEP